MSWEDTFRSPMRGNGNSTAPLAEPDFIERGQDAQQAPTVVAPPPISTGVKPVPAELGQPKLQGPTAIDGRELGATGTPNLAGFISDLGEYNPKLEGLEGIRIFEKMRRQDPTVAALEEAVTLPIVKAEWTVEPGDESALAKEIAQKVEDNLFGGLEYSDESGGKHTQTWESVVRNALLCAALGCSGSEDIWEIDRGGELPVRLARLAPRLPITFYQFVTDPNGDTLKTLIQFGFRRDTVDLFPVPASKVTIHSFKKEGSYFYGRSMLRPAYSPYFFKAKLMVIDAIGSERNRMAVPVVKQGPNASPDDVAKSWTWAENLTTNERAALSLPNGWDFTLMGIQGRAIDLVPTLRYYDEQIADAGLGGFLSLGKTATGSRALGDVKMNFFLLALNALAQMIGDNFTVASIRRLVDFNYQGKQNLPYPRLRPSDITILNVMDLVDAISKAGNAAVGWLNPHTNQVNYLLRRLGLPDITDLKEAKPVPRFAPVQIREIEQAATGETIQEIEDPRITHAAPPPPPPAAPPAPDATQAPAGRAVKDAAAFSASSSSSAPPAPRRPLKDFEKKHAYVAHAVRADTTARQVARILRQAKPDVVQKLAGQLKTLPMTSYEHAIVPFDHQLAARVEKATKTAFDFGHDQVYAERYRATGRGKSSPIQKLSERPEAIRLAAASSTKKSASFIAQATISDYSNELAKRARARAIDLSKQGLEGDDLEEGVANDVLAAPDGFLDRIGDEAGRMAVAGGRANALDELAPEIASYVRTEVMDSNTCGPCSDGDGTSWDSADEVDWAPGDDCEGGDGCRGQLIPVFADEGTVELE